MALLFSVSDEQAMWRVQNQDDHSAFALLVERWEERICQLCFRMIGNAHTAQDLTQEAFARLFAKRHAYDATKRFSTYLWRVALNLCYDELRRLRRRSEATLADGEAAAGQSFDDFATGLPAPDDWAMDQEEGELVKHALMQLPEIYRTVLVLRHYEGLKLREIAEVLGVPEGTVNSRMAEALLQLTPILSPALEGRKSTRSRARKPTDKKEILVV